MEKEQKQAITELADLLHQLNLNELEYEANGIRIRVAGDKIKKTEEVIVPPKKDPIQEKTKKTTINSPMVGVVYLFKDSGNTPFVKVGDHVSVGQTVCLIEAMKTFNPIKATKAGTVSEILVESGNPVEFGQPLFTLE